MPIQIIFDLSSDLIIVQPAGRLNSTCPPAMFVVHTVAKHQLILRATGRKRVWKRSNVSASRHAVEVTIPLYTDISCQSHGNTALTGNIHQEYLPR